ncbi:hypothetical protein SAMN04487995_5955 [Dyadobacter koreensis]|uniref:Uncharacterized protein n=1 Tax=Dyadobacter koreensis TaxID=408657 RepID=A0A1H7AWY1_9BACT|nr:hypothetical protein SAMN04487995_5955 [Dyadobacter koreensis]
MKECLHPASLGFKLFSLAGTFLEATFLPEQKQTLPDHTAPNSSQRIGLHSHI